MAGIIKSLYPGITGSRWTLNCWIRKDDLNRLAGDNVVNNSYVFGYNNDGPGQSTNPEGFGTMGVPGSGVTIHENEWGWYYNGGWVQGNFPSDQVGDDLDGWYNIHATENASGLQIYVNGVAIITNKSTNIGSSGGVLTLGGLSWVLDGPAYCLNGQMMNAFFIDGTSHDYTVFVENFSQTNNTLQPKDPAGVKAAINAAGGFGNNGFFYDFATPQTSGLKFDDLAGGQWRGINDYVGNFNTGFVRTGSSARTVNNSSTFLTGRTWQNGGSGSIQPSGLRSHEGEVFNPFHSDLTIEGWFYIPDNNNTATTAGTYFFDFRYANGGTTFANGPAMYFINGVLELWVNAQQVATYTVNRSDWEAQWFHLALTYTSADTKWQVYRNGTRIINATENYAGESSHLSIGCRYTDGQNIQMFVEGFRVTLANLYENNFNVPTADLTATTETKLLTCNAATLNDDSTSNHTITNAGSVTTSTTYVPYAGATSYFFDGTANAHLTIPTSTDFEINATDDYWVEFWISTVDTGRQDIISAFNPASPHEGWLIGLNFGSSNPGGIDLWSRGSSTQTTYSQAGPKINDGKWKHIALHWGSSAVKVYVNGIYSGQSTITNDRPFNSGSTIYIGRDANSTASRPFTGYLSNIRIIKGANAYTPSAATPYSFTPGPIDSIDQYTVDGGNTYKNISAHVQSCFNSNDKASTYNKGSEPQYQLRPFTGSTNQTGDVHLLATMCGASKYGKSSLYLRGTQAITPYGPDWNFSGDTDWTIETWIKFDNAQPASKSIISIERGDGDGYASYENLLLFTSANNTLILYANDSSSLAWASGFSGVSVGTYTLGKWHHFAYCRSASDDTVRVYWDGAQVQSKAMSLYNFTNPSLMLNGRWNTTYESNTNVYFDSFRVIQGQNIYPGGTTFTPGPTSSTTQYTLNGGSSYSSITGTVPFCLDDQRETLCQDKSTSDGTSPNGGVMYKDTPERLIQSGQFNNRESPSTIQGDSPRNKFLKFNALMSGNHSTAVANQRVDAAGLEVTAGTANSSNNFNQVVGNLGFTTGKYYFECKGVLARGDNNRFQVAIGCIDRFRTGQTDIVSSQGFYGVQVEGYTSGSSGVTLFYHVGGYGDSTSVAGDIGYTSPRGNGDIYGFAWDVDNHRLWVHQNGRWLNGGNPELNVGGLQIGNNMNRVHDDYWYSPDAESGTLGDRKLGYTVWAQPCTSGDNSNASGVIFNFGQGTLGDCHADASGKGKFKHKPPAGFNCMCTENQPALSTAAANPDAYVGVKEYTANGSSQAITGLGFQPDFMFTKRRDNTSGFFDVAVDSTRGTGRYWAINSVDANIRSNYTYSDQITSFDSDGFTVGNNSSGGNIMAANGGDYTAFAWKAGGEPGTGADAFKKDGSTFTPETSSLPINKMSCNTESGFSVVNYTGLTGTHNYNGSSNVTDISNSQSNLDVGGGDWTIEFWTYGSGAGEILNKGHNIQFYSNTGGDLLFYASSDGSSYNIASAVNMLAGPTGSGASMARTANRWHHVCVVRDATAGTYTGYFNGRKSFTINSSSNIANTSATWKIGAYNNAVGTASLNYHHSGYVCDFNVYTSKLYDPTLDRIDCVKPSWDNVNGTATNYLKSTTNLLFALNMRNSSFSVVTGNSGLNAYFSIAGTTGWQATSRPPQFVAHGQPGRPNMMLLKGTWNRGSGQNNFPIVICDGLSDTTPVLGETHVIVNGYYNNTYAADETVGNMTVSNYTLDSQVNDEGGDYTCYIWKQIPGFSRFGCNWAMPNDNSGYVHCGFRPKMVMILNVSDNDSGYVWHLYDTTRTTPKNGTYNSVFWPFYYNAQNFPGGTNNFHIYANGFEPAPTINGSQGFHQGENTNQKLLYFAWAEQPFAYANAR